MDTANNKCWFGKASTSGGSIAVSDNSWAVHIKPGNVNQKSLRRGPKTSHFVKNLLKHLLESSQLRSFRSVTSPTVAGISMCTESTVGQMSMRIDAQPCAPLTSPMPKAQIVTSLFLTMAFAIWDLWPERRICLPIQHLLNCPLKLVNQQRSSSLCDLRKIKIHVG